MDNQCEKILLPLMKGIFTAKKIKTGIADDGYTLSCEVYFNKKLAFNFNDRGDGVGGIVDFASTEMEKAMSDFIDEKDVRGIMYQNGWDFYKNADEISLESATDMIANSLAYEHVINKNEQSKIRKLKRLTKGNLVAGTIESYQYFGYKNINDLTTVLKYPNGLEMLQQTYDRLKSELKDGESILNTEEQLVSLGINL